MALNWKKHPILEPLTDAEILAWPEDKILEYHQAYHDAIANAEQDPLKYGFHLKPWADADRMLEDCPELWVYGGNRSSKTTYGARCVVRAALENPGSIIWCFAQDAKASVRTQQKAVYDWLPSEYKQNVKTSTGYIKYSLKNGFTGESLIIPETNSIIEFKTYSQFIANPGKFEGVELGSLEPNWLNIGIWLDEYLLGPDLVNTLRFRLATRDASMLGTFTPIDGMTEFVSSINKGAETVEMLPAELLDGEMVPYIQKSKTRNANMIYFHSEWNPFGGYKRLAKELKGRPKDEIRTRAYGVPISMMAGQFPKFRRSVNVMKHEDMMAIVSNDHMVTRYVSIDPAPSKRWFITWIAVDRDGCWYVYREWPGKDYGDWAEMGGNNKSKLGPASRPDGKGIADYVELFEELERGEKIYERLIDPRMGATPRQVEDGITTIIQQLEEHDLITIAAPGGLEDHGLTLLRGKMRYNDTQPVDATNRPLFYVSDECEQTIDSLQNYTAMEGPNEAWKDPIDTLRYAAAAEIMHEENFSMDTTKQGVGGY